jgi:C-terminal processing protease CtpA/Prc
MLGIVIRFAHPHALVALVLAVSLTAAAQTVSPERFSGDQDPYERAVREMLASPAGQAFLDAYIALRRDYLYGIDREALFEGATAGLVEALGDPFTRYLDPRDAEAARRASDATAVEIAQVGDVGIIRISTFEGDLVGSRFSTALDALLATGARAMVLDLRGNPGGSILQGLQVLDRFLSDGELGFRRVRGVSVPIAYANPRSISNPLVVLVDAQTASTAEIVAGTLQAYGRARLFGTPTAGKGVGQTAVRLADGAELRLVSFEWLLPGLRSIDAVGLTPDLLVTLEPVDPVSDGVGPPLVSVGEEGGDPTLRIAIDALRGLLSDDLTTDTPNAVPAVRIPSPTIRTNPDLDEDESLEEPTPVAAPEDENASPPPPP